MQPSNSGSGDETGAPRQHPVDQLIRELIITRRTASAEEIRLIIERMARVPFGQRPRVVPRQHRGLAYQGHTLGAREDPLVYHLIERVVQDDQWADGTTAAAYLADLRAAVLHPQARVLVYSRRGGYLAGTITPTEEILTLERRGIRWLRNLLVVYSADRGTLVTGYQFSTRERANIPDDALWLR